MDKCMMKERKRLSEKDPEVEKLKAKRMQELRNKASNSGEKLSVPITVTDADFERTVKMYPLVVVDCWAEWCGPCRMVAPVIEELAREHAGQIVFGKLNVDENPDTATRFGIMGIPTLLVMKNGVEVDRFVGASPKLMIESKLKKYMG